MAKGAIDSGVATLVHSKLRPDTFLNGLVRDQPSTSRAAPAISRRPVCRTPMHGPALSFPCHDRHDETHATRPESWPHVARDSIRRLRSRESSSFTYMNVGGALPMIFGRPLELKAA